MKLNTSSSLILTRGAKLKFMSEYRFGEMVREALIKGNISQRQLAERIGKSPTYINYVVRGFNSSSKSGKFQPGRDAVEMIARALGIGIDDALLAAGYAPATHAHHINGFKIDLPDDIEFVIPYSPHVTSQEQADQFRDAILTAYTITKERLAREQPN